MRTKVIIILLLFLSLDAFCQIPSFEHDFKSTDSIENPLIKSTLMDYDIIISYTEQNYWWSGRKYYQILAFKNNEWSNWYYSDFRIKETNNSDGTIKQDTIRDGKLYGGKKKLKHFNVSKLLFHFEQTGFWKLEREEINKTVNIDDGTNYRFEIFTRQKARVAESYMPDFYLEKNPEDINIRKFIENRDFFLKWWNKYCH
jgi:hypothetical protein